MPTMPLSEKVIETYLREQIKKLGGVALKFVSPAFTGVPDRIVLLPGGVLYFVETKAPGKDLRPRQRVVKDLIEKLGFTYYKIDSKEQIANLCNTYRDRIKLTPPNE